MATPAAFNPSDFLTKHVIAAYVRIESKPIVNGVELDDKIIQKVAVDTLALPAANTYFATYIKVEGRQAYPEVTSAEAGSTAQLRVESRPDGIGLTKLVGAGGGLSPTPIAWKHTLAGLYVAAHRLTTVIVPAGKLIALVAQQGAQNVWGASFDGIPASIEMVAGNSASPSYTAYLVGDDGSIVQEDLGGNAGTPIIPQKGIYLFAQTNLAYKYLVIKAPDTSDLEIITVNEVAQVVEVAS